MKKIALLLATLIITTSVFLQKEDQNKEEIKTD